MKLQTPLGTINFVWTTEKESGTEAEGTLQRVGVTKFLKSKGVKQIWAAYWRMQIKGDPGLVRFSFAWEPGYLWNDDIGSNSGQYLDAYRYSTDEWNLSIGTDDEEMLGIRAKQGQGIPIHAQFHDAEYEEGGFSVPIGGLKDGDECWIYFAVAWAKASDDVGDWLAVDTANWKYRMPFVR
ncbi:hypothetical protein CBW65_17160 [Tumebacillus avium]|uniref:Uncharacterized protein n=1 Tax=Tumebacillus avium TaxID=1903704 RepID=A0A1Y0IPZ2_9BACL|nr:hypothetical protein [Tumebacillus avium]ARU62497.1 hypothetical protein CBW65_17160 [Tumebacillus avium]